MATLAFLVSYQMCGIRIEKNSEGSSSKGIRLLSRASHMYAAPPRVNALRKTNLSLGIALSR